MHEFSIMQSVMENVERVAKEHHARRIEAINLRIGDMTEVVQDSLDFAFEVLRQGTLAEDATLHVETIKPFSECLDCGNTFEHERTDLRCPACGSSITKQLKGHELDIASIELDIPENQS